MHQLVRFHGGGLIETLAANLAREGPFSRVHKNVTIELGLTAELFLASFALKDLHSVEPFQCVR